MIRPFLNFSMHSLPVVASLMIGSQQLQAQEITKSFCFLSEKDCSIWINSYEESLAERTQAIQNGDSVGVLKATQSVNFFYELLLSKDYTEVAAVERKYSLLSALLTEELENASVGEKNWEDLNGSNIASVYHPTELVESRRIQEIYGKLYVAESSEDPQVNRHDQVAIDPPWSGYWYPFRDKSLYTGNESPLRKFDRLLLASNRVAKVAEWEKSFRESLTTDGWEGLCDAWAIAASITKEPTINLNLRGVVFTPADQKALLTLSHLKYPSQKFGIPYKGDASTDGTYQDLRPEIFHQIAVKVLGEEKLPLIVDDTAGVEVWNKPLYRYRWNIKKDPTHNNAFIVKGFPWYIKQRDSETIEATNPTNDRVAPVYHYRLFVDPAAISAGKYLVIAGEWIEDSRDNHPDYVTTVSRNGAGGSHNLELNKNLDVIQKSFIQPRS